jgi:hypothetical protein
MTVENKTPKITSIFFMMIVFNVLLASLHLAIDDYIILRLTQV